MPVEEWVITNRAEWLAKRQQDITASDIGGLSGVDDYRSPLRIWAEKTGQISGPDETNLMRRGRWLEPAVARAISETFPDWSIEPSKVYLRDPELRLGATPDYVGTRPDLEGRGNIQMKVIARPTYEREWRDGHAPLKYQLQSLTEAMLLGSQWNCVAALIIDVYSADLVVNEIPRHPAAEERIKELVGEFWAMVARGEQPNPSFKHDAALIRTMHPRGGRKPALDLTQHNRISFLAQEHLEWAKRRQHAEGALEEVDAEITSILGDYDEAEHPEYRISWKLQQRKEVFLPATEYRVLRIQPKKQPQEKSHHG